MKTTYLSGALLAAVISAAPGCSKPEAAATAEVTASAESAMGPDAYVEAHDGGAVVWDVGPDGNVKAEVKGPDQKPIRDGLSGTLAWKGNGDAKPVPLTFDPKAGLLVAAGPKLDADLTEIGYTLTVAGKPWTGTLHVPAGGTAELAAGAKASAELALPEGKLGPHGGRIQVVGKDRLELVVDEVTGGVRVYVLDADLKAIAVGDRKITLGVVADAPQVVVLAPAEAGAYLTGKLALAAEPLKVTIAVRSAAQAAVALIGYRVGAAFAVGASAPRVKVRVKTDWGVHADVPDVDVKLKGDAHVDPKVKVDVHAKAIADAKAKVDVHAKAIADAKANVNVKAPSVSIKVQAPKVEVPKPSFKASASAKASAGLKLH